MRFLSAAEDLTILTDSLSCMNLLKRLSAAAAAAAAAAARLQRRRRRSRRRSRRLSRRSPAGAVNLAAAIDIADAVSLT